MNLYFSILSSIYIFYMFNYFKTDIYFSHPFDIYTNNISFLNHSQKSNHVCRLGNLVGYFLTIWFIVRHFLSFSKKTLQNINILILNTVLIGSFLTNMNAFIYYLPLYIFEIYLNKRFIKKNII